MGKVSDLPNELLRYLFLLLSPEDRKVAVLVEQRWRKVGEDPVLWKWCSVSINNGGDINKLAVKRFNHVQQIEVNSEYNWQLGQLEELLKDTLELPKLKQIINLELVDISEVDSELLGNALGKLEEIRLCGYKNRNFPVNARTTNQQRLAIFTKMSRNDCVKTLFLERLDLSTLEIDAEVLAKVMSSLQELELNFVSFSNDQVQKLFEFMSQSNKLNEIRVISLDVSTIEPDLFGKAITNIGDVFLEEVEISSNQMRSIFNEMEQNRRIKSFVSIDTNINMSRVEPKVFARGVSKLERFSLLSNAQGLSFFSNEHVIALFAELKQNCKLTLLELPGDNDLSSIDPEDFAKVVNNIEEVFLCNANLSTDQITSVLKLVQKNSKLKQLVILNNRISDVDPALVTAAKEKLDEFEFGFEFDYDEGEEDNNSDIESEVDGSDGDNDTGSGSDEDNNSNIESEVDGSDGDNDNESGGDEDNKSAIKSEGDGNEEDNISDNSIGNESG